MKNGETDEHETAHQHIDEHDENDKYGEHAEQ